MTLLLLSEIAAQILYVGTLLTYRIMGSVLWC